MPVIDAVAEDYLDSVRFLAIAGESNDYEKTATRAEELFDDLDWTLDQSIWDLYGVFSQPHSILITGTDVIVDGWFGEAGEEHLRTALDRLLSLEA